MKVVVLILCCVIAGCSLPSFVKPQLVYADRPVFVCPLPPTIADPVLYTPTLTPADKADPGKVAQYYKADMIILRGSVDQYKLIIDQYTKASIDAAKLQQQVEQLYKDSNQKAASIVTTP